MSVFGTTSRIPPEVPAMTLMERAPEKAQSQAYVR
jgi:hypothetical protein